MLQRLLSAIKNRRRVISYEVRMYPRLYWRGYVLFRTFTPGTAFEFAAQQIEDLRQQGISLPSFRVKVRLKKVRISAITKARNFPLKER